MSPDISYDFFLVHSGDEVDLAFARRIYRDLCRRGFTAFFGPASMMPGDDFTRAIPEALAASEVVVVVCSGHLGASPYASDGIVAALRARTARVVPILLDGSPVPFGLNGAVPIQVTEGDTAEGIAGRLGRLRPGGAAADDARAPVRWTWRLAQQGRHHFVGRTGELEALDRAWQIGANLVVLTAWAGVGKTAVVTHWLTRSERGLLADVDILAFSFPSQDGGKASSEEFLERALLHLGVEPEQDAGRKVSQLIDALRARPTVLVLDGIEPLQDMHDGTLTDPHLKRLLRELAMANVGGMCIVTSRRALTDAHRGERMRPLTLDPLPVGDAVALLRKLDVQGGDAALTELADRWKCHALSLTLLGGFLRRFHDGRVLAQPWIDERADLGPVDGLLEAYAARLPPAESELLTVLSLFDRAIPQEHAQLLFQGLAAAEPPRRPSYFDPDAWDRLIGSLGGEPTLAGISRVLGRPGHPWQATIEALGRLGLSSREPAEYQGITMHMLDLHPLVRRAFRARVARRFPDEWVEANRRIYIFLVEFAPRLPRDQRGVDLLLMACRHAVVSGHGRAALRKIGPRVNHGPGRYFANRILGAHAALLATLGHFFDEPCENGPPTYEKIKADLGPAEEAEIRWWVGFDLCATGRLGDGIRVMQGAAAMFSNFLHDTGGARAARKAAEVHTELAERLLLAGDLPGAEAAARQAITFSDSTRDEGGPREMPILRWRVESRTILAACRYCAGDLDGARQLYGDAQALKREDEHHPMLHSVAAYRHYEFLIATARGDDDLHRIRELLDEQESLEAAQRERDEAHVPSVLAAGLLRLVRARVLRRLQPEAAGQHFDRAVKMIRDSSRKPYLPLGLLARANHRRRRGDLPGARADVDEALQIANEGDMKLRIADSLVTRARLMVAEGEMQAAREAWAEAQRLARQMEYRQCSRRLAGLSAAVGGVTVVYAHGLGSSPESAKAAWIRAGARALGLPVVAPSLPGPPEVDIDRVVHALEATLDGIEGDVILVGSSLGGYGCLLAAAKAVAGARAVTGDHHIRGVLLLAPAVGLRSIIEAHLTDGIEAAWKAQGVIDAPSGEGSSVQLGHHYLEAARRRDPWPDVGPVPVRIVHGRGDRQVPIAVSEAYCRRFPATTLLKVHGDHDMAAAERVVQRHIADFLVDHLPGWQQPR